MHNIYRLEPFLNKSIGDDQFSIDFCFGLQAQSTDRTDAKINIFHTVQMKMIYFVRTIDQRWQEVREVSPSGIRVVGEVGLISPNCPTPSVRARDMFQYQKRNRRKQIEN